MKEKYYVQACVEDCAFGHKDYRAARDDEIPDIWSVYERQVDGTSYCVADFGDEDHAREYAKWLMER